VDTESTTGDEWVEPEQLSAELRLPLRTLYQWRSRGVGPPGYKIGRHVRYRRSDVERWLVTRRDEPRAVG
jgi:excisionase family DNA binding protein